jgi:hypothetical protein
MDGGILETVAMPKKQMTAHTSIVNFSLLGHIEIDLIGG